MPAVARGRGTMLTILPAAVLTLTVSESPYRSIVKSSFSEKGTCTVMRIMASCFSNTYGWPL